MVNSRHLARACVSFGKLHTSQAQSRIEAAGYTGVTELAKDKNGIWRGMAMKNGASTHVSVDYQGNVIAN